MENLSKYKKYVGKFVKRFYTKFDQQSIFAINGFKYSAIHGYCFECIDEFGATWLWDVDDCIIITNDKVVIQDDRVANVNHDAYTDDMFNPFADEVFLKQFPCIVL